MMLPATPTDLVSRLRLATAKRAVDPQQHEQTL
jgi:hypothetical protein